MKSIISSREILKAGGLVIIGGAAGGCATARPAATRWRRGRPARLPRRGKRNTLCLAPETMRRVNT